MSRSSWPRPNDSARGWGFGNRRANAWMAGSMLLSLLRSEGQASLDAVGERFVMAPPSGDDTLQVRQTYLRKRRSRPILHVGARPEGWTPVATREGYREPQSRRAS